MKKLSSLLFLSFPMFLIAQGDQMVSMPAEDPCVSGIVQNFQYNSDSSIYVTVGDKTLYSKEWNVQPLIADAFYSGFPVQLYADVCQTGKSFTKMKFLRSLP